MIGRGSVSTQRPLHPRMELGLCACRVRSSNLSFTLSILNPRGHQTLLHHQNGMAPKEEHFPPPGGIKSGYPPRRYPPRRYPFRRSPGGQLLGERGTGMTQVLYSTRFLVPLRMTAICRVKCKPPNRRRVPINHDQILKHCLLESQISGTKSTLTTYGNESLW